MFVGWVTNNILRIQYRDTESDIPRIKLYNCCFSFCIAVADILGLNVIILFSVIYKYYIINYIHSLYEKFDNKCKYCIKKLKKVRNIYFCVEFNI